MTLPRFLGLGAMKAGTSLVHDLLAEHPEVAVPSHRKEVMFFDRDHDRGLDWYAKHFEHARPGQVPGEVTPGYLFHPEAAARIHAALPEVRLFAILRDPVARVHSQYRFFVKERAYPHGPDRYLDEHPGAVDRSRYTEQLARYDARFDDEQLLVLLFEDLIADPTATMARIYRHIGVDPSFRPPSAGARRNASTVPRWHRAYALGRRGLRWLYAHDLAPVVHGLKRLGLKRLFVSSAPERQRFEAFSASTRAGLVRELAPEVTALSDRLGRDLSTVWTTTCPDGGSPTP